MKSFHEQTLKSSTTLRVLFADTDAMSVVYNGTYFRYFEAGRNELLRFHGIPYAELESLGYLLPVLSCHADFHLPARYDDLVEISSTYLMRYSPHIRIDYEIRRDGMLLVSGFTTHSFVERSSFKPIRPPAIFWKRLGGLSRQ